MIIVIIAIIVITVIIVIIEIIVIIVIIVIIEIIVTFQANDYMNVILVSLCHVTPVREFFLEESNYSKIKLPPGSIMYQLVQVNSRIHFR